MMALVAPPTLPLRKPFDAGTLPLSIVVDMVEVSGLGEGERMLRVEDSLKVMFVLGGEVGRDNEYYRDCCRWQINDKRSKVEDGVG